MLMQGICSIEYNNSKLKLLHLYAERFSILETEAIQLT